MNKFSIQIRKDVAYVCDEIYVSPEELDWLAWYPRLQGCQFNIKSYLRFFLGRAVL
jgi:hypothetical protein